MTETQMTPPILFAAAREGFHVPGAEAFYQESLVDIHVWGVDLSINRTVLILFAATLITSTLFFFAFRKPKLVPRGLQNVMEFIVDFVRNQIALPTMGRDGLVFLPYLTVLFTFIFFLNIFGIIPGVNFPASSRLAIPLVFAIGTWLLFIGVGIKSQGLGGYFKNSLVPPGVPVPVLFILVPMEFLSIFILRPVTLTIRLTANMIAGHLLLTVIFLGTSYLLERQLTIGWGVGSALAGVAFVGFELFVASLQAFIFTMLTAVYISGSLKAAH
jgi:F-type H+-transporting ATPase subunit a